MRTGVRIGVDAGTVRVGVAASDPAGVLASPVTVLHRQERTGADVDEIAVIVAERNAVEVVVGLPRSLDGRERASAASARDFARQVARRVAPVPVRVVDERMSTVSAQRGLYAAGRTARTSRAVIDAAAAVVILQGALDAERESARPPGELVAG